MRPPNTRPPSRRNPFPVTISTTRRFWADESAREMRHRAFGRGQVGRGPARDLELGVTRLVAVLDPVAVLEAHPALGVDQHRPERLVAGLERLAGQLHAAAQVPEVGLAVAHSSRAARRPGGDGPCPETLEHNARGRAREDDVCVEVETREHRGGRVSDSKRGRFRRCLALDDANGVTGRPRTRRGVVGAPVADDHNVELARRKTREQRMQAALDHRRLVVSGDHNRARRLPSRHLHFADPLRAIIIRGSCLWE